MTIPNLYFKAKNHCIAVNAGVGTNSVCAGIVADAAPVRAELYQSPADKLAAKPVSDFAWRTMVYQTAAPDKPIVVLLRDPYKRFASKATMLGMTIDQALNKLEAGEFADEPAFAPQARFIKPGVTVFSFPSQIDQFCALVGFTIPLKKLNKTATTQTATLAQRTRIALNYPADIEAWTLYGAGL